MMIDYERSMINFHRNMMVSGRLAVCDVVTLKLFLRTKETFSRNQETGKEYYSFSKQTLHGLNRVLGWFTQKSPSVGPKVPKRCGGVQCQAFLSSSQD